MLHHCMLSDTLVPFLLFDWEMFVAIACLWTRHWLLVSLLTVLSRLGVSALEERTGFGAGFLAVMGTGPGNDGYGAHAC